MEERDVLIVSGHGESEREDGSDRASEGLYGRDGENSGTDRETRKKAGCVSRIVGKSVAR